MALERWQKYLAKQPCPICGGFSSGRKKDKKMCKGYLHSDGIHAFCQQNKSLVNVNIHGLVLYKHKLDGADILVPQRKDNLPEPTSVVYGDFKDICVVEETTRYEGRKVLRQKLPPFNVTWYIVMKKGEEITRDVSLERMKRFVDVLTSPQNYWEVHSLPSLESQSPDPSLHQKS